MLESHVACVASTLTARVSKRVRFLRDLQLHDAIPRRNWEGETGLKRLEEKRFEILWRANRLKRYLPVRFLTNLSISFLIFSEG